jgi:hypothetical protein
MRKYWTRGITQPHTPLVSHFIRYSNVLLRWDLEFKTITTYITNRIGDRRTGRTMLYSWHQKFVIDTKSIIITIPQELGLDSQKICHFNSIVTFKAYLFKFHFTNILQLKSASLHSEISKLTFSMNFSFCLHVHMSYVSFDPWFD